MSSNNSEPMVQAEIFLPLMMEDLTPELIRKAEKELNETPENRRKGLEELRNLINAEDDFQPRMDDKFLLRFLRAKKFKVKAAMKTLKNYYTSKAYHSRTVTEKLPSEVKHIFDLNFLTVLPQRDREGRVVAISRVGNCDLSKKFLDELLATFYNIAEILLESEATQICGIVYISDNKDIYLRHIRQAIFNPNLFRILKVFQDCVPIRIRAIHITNQPFYHKLFFAVLRPFLTEKMNNRIHFHGENFESLHKEVPPEILPQEFGGHQGHFESSIISKEVLIAEDYFWKQFKFGFKGKRA